MLRRRRWPSAADRHVVTRRSRQTSWRLRTCVGASDVLGHIASPRLRRYGVSADIGGCVGKKTTTTVLPLDWLQCSAHENRLQLSNSFCRWTKSFYWPAYTKCRGQYCFALWRLSSSCVTLHGGPAGGFTRASQAMTSCRLQSNYSSTVTLHGGPVVLRPVRAKPCVSESSVPLIPSQPKFRSTPPKVVVVAVARMVILTWRKQTSTSRSLLALYMMDLRIFYLKFHRLGQAGCHVTWRRKRPSGSSRDFSTAASWDTNVDLGDVESAACKLNSHRSRSSGCNLQFWFSVTVSHPSSYWALCFPPVTSDFDQWPYMWTAHTHGWYSLVILYWRTTCCNPPHAGARDFSCHYRFSRCISRWGRCGFVALTEADWFARQVAQRIFIQSMSTGAPTRVPAEKWKLSIRQNTQIQENHLRS